MIRLPVAFTGVALAATILLSSAAPANAAPMNAVVAAQASSTHRTKIQLGSSKAYFELDEVKRSGHIQGYKAKIVSSKGKVLFHLGVSKAQGSKLLKFVKKQHVFKSLKELVLKLTTKLIGF